MNNQQYVTISELTEQILKVEGVEVNVLQFAHKKRHLIKRLRYPAYPYTTRFTGSIEKLVEQRIRPIIEKEIVVDEEEL